MALPAQPSHHQNPSAVPRKPVTLPSEETLPSNERLLYFSPNDSDASATLSSLVSMTATNPDPEETELGATKEAKAGSAAALHDTILATQLRHINRELTPTISEVGQCQSESTNPNDPIALQVYHERNIGLGLAPPLSKLLLNQSSSSAPKTDNSVLEKITLGKAGTWQPRCMGLPHAWLNLRGDFLGILDDEDISNELNSSQCQRCNSESCACQKSKSNKPWLTENAIALQQIQSSDLTTADILEREVKNKLVLR